MQTKRSTRSAGIWMLFSLPLFVGCLAAGRAENVQPVKAPLISAGVESASQIALHVNTYRWEGPPQIIALAEPVHVEVVNESTLTIDVSRHSFVVLLASGEAIYPLDPMELATQMNVAERRKGRRATGQDQFTYSTGRAPLLVPYPESGAPRGGALQYRPYQRADWPARLTNAAFLRKVIEPGQQQAGYLYFDKRFASREPVALRLAVQSATRRELVEFIDLPFPSQGPRAHAKVPAPTAY